MDTEIERLLKAAKKYYMIVGALRFAMFAKMFVTYTAIAEVVHLFAGSAFLASLLGKVQAYCIANGQPIWTAIVIKEHVGIPGPGFWASLRKQGIKMGSTPKDEFEFWMAEIDKLGGYKLNQDARNLAAQLGVIVPPHLV